MFFDTATGIQIQMEMQQLINSFNGYLVSIKYGQPRSPLTEKFYRQQFLELELKTLRFLLSEIETYRFLKQF